MTPEAAAGLPGDKLEHKRVVAAGKAVLKAAGEGFTFGGREIAGQGAVELIEVPDEGAEADAAGGADVLEIDPPEGRGD